MKRKLGAFIFSFFLLVTFHTSNVYAAVYNAGTDDEFSVTDIELQKNYEGTSSTDGLVIIKGSNLAGREILFRVKSEGLVKIGQRTQDFSSLVQFNFTNEEIESLTGDIYIDGAVQGASIELSLSNFPDISSVERVNINTDAGGDLILNGTNFDTLSDTSIDVTMSYGKSDKKIIQEQEENPETIIEPEKITVTDISAPGPLGFQDILVEKTEILGNGINVQITYEYSKAFRLLENVGLENIIMYPNTTTKGGEIYFQSASFTGADYEVYLMDQETNFTEFLETNKTTFVNFDTTNNLLTVRVPENDVFELGEYEVYITKVSSRETGEIIAFEALEDELLSVVEANFLPRITSIYPKEGMSTGEKVEIEGSNLISLNIPGLTMETPGDEEIILESGDSTDNLLKFKYSLPPNGKFMYNSEEVTITRDISVQIGEVAAFQKNADDTYKFFANLITGSDTLFIETEKITELGEDPYRDVIIQMNTSLVSENQTYKFNYRITETDGFKYIPSSIEPIITSITPNRAQVTGNESLSKPMEFSLEGDNFLVNEYTEEGTTYVNRPVILIKTANNQTGTDYDIKIDPNRDYNGQKGVIISKLPDENGKTEYALEYEIINNNEQVVTGTEVNEIGQRIIFRLPQGIALNLDDTTKNIQVINPSRGSEETGDKIINQNLLEFIQTTDAPVIESVEPTLVTVEGGVEVQVTGSNFKEGVQVYLDGKEITGVQREIDASGNQVVLIFTAPANRVTNTQLQVINPSGGIDVADFFYIDSFEKDPIITRFTPEKGRKDTLVSITGDNFLTSNPTVENLIGINAYTMIGTRVKLDGEDVNKYNYLGKGINFDKYTLPAPVALYDKSDSNIRLTDFKENVSVKGADEDYSFYKFYLNQNKAIIVFDEDEEYILPFDEIPTIMTDDLVSENDFIEMDGDTLVTTLTLKNVEEDQLTKSFDFIMNNEIISSYEMSKDLYTLQLANYAENVFLKNTVDNVTEYYKIYKDYDNEIIITNGQNNYYRIRAQENNIIALDDVDVSYTVAIGENTLTIGGDLELEYMTPYRYRTVEDDEDIYSDDQYIYGNATEVISKNQILFKVPALQTGTGFKDLSVENPDTRSDSRLGTEGFYYRKQSQSNPEIYNVTPNKGSIDGGYTVTVKGDDFSASPVAPTRVFIDGVEVPEEDMEINLDETEIRVKVPKITKDIRGDFGIDELSVPVVVLNDDGGSAVLENGFTYIVPSSEPRITSYNPKEGSSNGDTIVEIRGTEFSFFEPYEGNDAYTEGDIYEDLDNSGAWDDLLDTPLDDSYLIDYENFRYYKSPVLPKVYFGQEQGKILEYGNGYLKVLSPMSQRGGRIDLYVVNNDLGVSNVVDFTYTQSAPQINSIIPNIGRLQGQESKDLYGVGLENSAFRGYMDNDNVEAIVEIENLDAGIRFGNIDNLNIERQSPNSGQINSGRATVNLTGGLEVSYTPGDDPGVANLEVSITSNNQKYERKFEKYDQSEVYIPIEMLKKEGEDLYYRPFGYEGLEPDNYTDTRFEFIKVYVDDRRMFVERGYAPEVNYDNKNHVQLKTPAYYTTGPVDVTYVNPDGGKGTGRFTYTNPASRPKILQVEPRELKFDASSWLVFGTIEGKKQLEIIGEDFRDGASVTINGKDAPVIDFVSKKMSDGKTYDVLIVQIPQGVDADVDKEYPIIVTNKDFGIANSALDENLLIPIEDVNEDGSVNEEDKLHYYFVYQKPLSGPAIGEVIPKQTSIAGDNEIKILGEDFRQGAYVIIGSVGGVPIDPVDKVDSKGQYIIFTTPRGLTLGTKDVQIINSDYGIDIIEDGLEIISAPETDEVLTEDGRDPQERVSIEGGDKITIKGEFFQDGAEVYFGGLYQEEKDEGLQGPRGLYTNDKTYVVENGVAAQNVEYIDSETLLVTTPVLEDEDDYSIVVINKDGGITDDNLSIKGREPIPSDPVGLKAELVDDRYIKIYGYYSENVDYYEIYAVIEDDRSRRDLIRNDFRDFNYLDTTDFEPYKITDLPGIETMDDDESLYIVLKAVNKYGPSNWSNIVELDYERDDLEDIEDFGNPDADGDLGVPEGESHEVIRDEEKLRVTIAAGNYGSVVVDLSDEANKNTRIINIPSEKVRSDYNYISVNFGDAYLQFSPRSLNTNTFNQFYYKNSKDSYVTVENKVLEDDYSALMRSYLPRGKKAISPVQEVSARVRNNTSEMALETYNSPLDFGLYYNSDYLRPGQRIGIYRFNEETNIWAAVETTKNETLKVLTTKVLENGYYVILKY